jgi:2-polyprenyl-3-methyl-5-hydroxy-6-metoxy-1,4-benzoquinol methylase
MHLSLERKGMMNLYKDYIKNKQWNEKDFSKLSPGKEFYFTQTINTGKIGKLSVLEVGFGNGELLAFFRKKTENITGIEISSELVERARFHGYKSYCGWVCDIKQLDDNLFNYIIVIDVIEHMSHKQINEFFLWACDRLEEDGVLHLRFPEGSSPFGLSNQNGDTTHVSIITKDKIKEFCSVTNGLTLEKYYDDLLQSNSLCKLGLFGKFLLKFIQWYAAILRYILKFFFFPLSPSTRFGNNSIAIIKKNNTQNAIKK